MVIVYTDLYKINNTIVCLHAFKSDSFGSQNSELLFPSMSLTESHATEMCGVFWGIKTNT